MKLLLKVIGCLCLITSFTNDQACAEGTLVISNTNQPITGYISESDGARAVFIPGSDPGGYQFTGFSVELGNNSSVSHGPMHVILYGSNDPGNLDQIISDCFITVPVPPGLYYFAWPTNCYLPPQYPDAPLYYYHLLFVPAVSDELNVAYTTGTGYNFFDAWTFDAEASVIDGEPDNYTMVNLYASILPTPILQPIHLRDAAVLSDNSFQFGFTNSTAYSFSVYFVTNLAPPLTNWIYAGPAENIISNYFQFNTGPNVVHNPAYPPNLYFRVSSP